MIYDYLIGGSSSQEIFTKDSLTMAFGSQEHLGRVRGMRMGPCPSQLGSTSHIGGNSLGSSNAAL